MRTGDICSIIAPVPAGVMELVDVTDSKSVGLIPRVGSSPTTGTSSEIPATVSFPPAAKTALWQEFLRLRMKPASRLSSEEGKTILF